MSHSHMAWCFVKGFGALTAGIGAVVLVFWLFGSLCNLIARWGDWETENVLGVLVGSLIFLIFGTVISLGICGVIK